MRYKGTVIRTSSWLLDVLIGLYAIGFLAMLVMLIVNGNAPNEFSLILPGKNYLSWIAQPEVVAGPGMEGVFGVTDVRPIGYRLGIEFKDNRFYILYIPTLIYALIYFYVMILLGRLVRSAKNDDFFNYKNVSRLRIIGLIILSTLVFNWLSTFIKGWFFDNYLVSTDITHTKSIAIALPNLFSSPIVIGLLILIISEAFAYGLKLKQEQDLTI